VVSLIKRGVLVNDHWGEGLIILQLHDFSPIRDREVHDNGFGLKNRDALAMKPSGNSLGIIGFGMITREVPVDRIETVRDG
jgi:hypothetical protein